MAGTLRSGHAQLPCGVILYCNKNGAGVIGYTVRPNFRSGGPYYLREYGPPRTQLPREYGPSKILYIQGIQFGGGGGLNSLIKWRFDFDDPVYSVYN